MSDYTKAVEVMEELFAKDCTFAMATAADNIPSVRFLDTYYQDGAFYIVTHAALQKVKELERNPHTALANHFYRFSGRGYNIGHPHKPENKALRETLMRVFEPWYLPHNNEDDEKMCYVKVELDKGFFYKDGTGYRVDFAAKTAETFPCDLPTD